jgi:hypothetical protein
MNLEQVKQHILSWSENFLEQPHPALGNWSPCPYARRARLNNQVAVRLGSDPYHDLETLCSTGLGSSQVVIYAYDPAEWTREIFTPRLEAANRDFLLAADLIVLEDHPADPEIVNGVSMNQGTYALAMCQSLSDLDVKARMMASKGFYHTWPEQYLETLFEHRQDPRT